MIDLYVASLNATKVLTDQPLSSSPEPVKVMFVLLPNALAELVPSATSSITSRVSSYVAS